MPFQKIPLPGYQSPNGYANKLVWAGDYFGNNNYQQGGDKSYASDFSMSGIESYGVSFSGVSYSGNYYVKVTAPANNGSSSSGPFAPTFNNVTLTWYIASNNAQVANNANLAAEAIRIEVRGV